jgi:hypothetical protein
VVKADEYLSLDLKVELLGDRVKLLLAAEGPEIEPLLLE